MISNDSESGVAPGTIVTWEADATTLRLLRISPKRATLLGYPLETWRGDAFWRAVVHALDRDRFFSILARASADPSEATCQIRLVACDGSTHWFFVHVHAHRRKAGAPSTLRGQMIQLAAGTDELAALERMAAESEAAYRRADEALALAGGWVDLNRALASTTTTDELADVIVHKALPRMGASAGALVLLAAGGMQLQLVRSAELPDEIVGTLRRFSLLAPLPAADSVRTERSLWFESTELLISRYPRLAATFSSQERKAFAVVPLAANGTWLGALQMHFEGEHGFDQNERTRIDQLVEICAQALGRVRAIESANQTKVLLGAAAHAPISASLTPRTAWPIENARVRADAKRAVRDRENILSIVSHDLKNPLTSIVMCASTLFRSEFALSESGQKCVGIIQKAAGQMMALVEDLLDVGTIGANSLRLQTARWDCSDLLAEAVELLEPIATQRSLELVVNAPPLACAAHCDRQRIVQVLSNLIGNAIKFAGHGQIVVDCKEQGASVVFAVRDSGPGIPANQLDKIFTARWHALQPGREGTGLGLSISSSLVEAHGGRIWVESQPGRGSTFFFTLPRASMGVRSRSVALPSAAERRLISLAPS